MTFFWKCNFIKRLISVLFILNLHHLICLCQMVHTCLHNLKFFLHHVNAQYWNYLIPYIEVQIHEVKLSFLDELDIIAIQKLLLLLNSSQDVLPSSSYDIIYPVSHLPMTWNEPSMMSDLISVLVKHQFVLDQWYFDHCVHHSHKFSLVLGNCCLESWQHQLHPCSGQFLLVIGYFYLYQ